jgi:hypothetical protein
MTAYPEVTKTQTIRKRSSRGNWNRTSLWSLPKARFATSDCFCMTTSPECNRWASLRQAHAAKQVRVTWITAQRVEPGIHPGRRQSIRTVTMSLLQPSKSLILFSQHRICHVKSADVTLPGLTLDATHHCSSFILPTGKGIGRGDLRQNHRLLVVHGAIGCGQCSFHLAKLRIGALGHDRRVPPFARPRWIPGSALQGTAAMRGHRVTKAKHWPRAAFGSSMEFPQARLANAVFHQNSAALPKTAEAAKGIPATIDLTLNNAMISAKKGGVLTGGRSRVVLCVTCGSSPLP